MRSRRDGGSAPRRRGQLFRALRLGDVLEQPLVEKQLAAIVQHGAEGRAGPEGRPVQAAHLHLDVPYHPLGLDERQPAHSIAWVYVEIFGPGVKQRVAGWGAEALDERSVDVRNTPVRRCSKESDREPLPEVLCGCPSRHRQTHLGPCIWSMRSKLANINTVLGPPRANPLDSSNRMRSFSRRLVLGGRFRNIGLRRHGPMYHG